MSDEVQGGDDWFTNGQSLQPNSVAGSYEFEIPYTPSLYDPVGGSHRDSNPPLPPPMLNTKANSSDHPMQYTLGTPTMMTMSHPTPIPTSHEQQLMHDQQHQSQQGGYVSRMSNQFSSPHPSNIDASFLPPAKLQPYNNLFSHQNGVQPGGHFADVLRPAHDPHPNSIPSSHRSSHHSSSEMEYMSDEPRSYPSSHLSSSSHMSSSYHRPDAEVGSYTSDSSAASGDLNGGLSSSSESVSHSSSHTSPLISTPEPQTPNTLPTMSVQTRSQLHLATNSRHHPTSMPTPLHSTRSTVSTATHPASGTTSGASSPPNVIVETVPEKSGYSSVGGGNTSGGIVSTLQSPTDILLAIHLVSGGNKKKTWASRTVSLQSLSNGVAAAAAHALSYAQLLFHVSNINTFTRVVVEGRDVADAGEVGPDGTATESMGSVTVQGHPALKTRASQLAQAIKNGTLGNGAMKRENGSNNSSRESSGNSQSARSTPSDVSSSAVSPKDTNPLQVPINITFHLPDNVKSCTRLGCINLLINKANRRACQICQSHGADMRHAFLRRLVINTASLQATSQFAYVEQILEDQLTEYWKFDAAEETTGSSAQAAASTQSNHFPPQTVGYYLAFTDAGTAAHVTRDFNKKIGYTGSTSVSGYSQSILQNGSAPTAMCDVDSAHAYAIKMKSHFWMLEVKPAGGATGSGASRVKSKFYKKVGKPNQNRVAAAAALAQHQAAQMNDNDQGMVAYRKRRFEEDQQSSMPNMLAVNHINHISINMGPGGHMGQGALMPGGANAMLSHLGRPLLLPPKSGGATIELLNDNGTPTLQDPISTSNNVMNQANQMNTSSSNGSSSVGAQNSNHPLSTQPTSAQVNIIPPAPQSGPTNTVHVSENSFRLMKNQPVNAMMNIHDTSSSSTAAASSSSSNPQDTVDSKPLVSAPTPVVLVYRDVDAYQRDQLMNGGNGGFNGGGANGGNDNNFNNNGNGNNHSNNGSNKRGRFDDSNNGGGGNSGNGGNGLNYSGSDMNFSMLGLNPGGMIGMGNGSTTTYNMTTVGTPLLANLGVGAIDPSNMANVAAAMNQIQLAQQVQAAQQQAVIQQNIFQAQQAAAVVQQRHAQLQQQHTQQLRDFGRFPAPWMFADRSGQPLSEQAHVNDPAARKSRRNKQPEVDANGDAITRDDEEKDEGDEIDTASQNSDDSFVGHDAAISDDDDAYDTSVADASPQHDIDEEQQGDVPLTKTAVVRRKNAGAGATSEPGTASEKSTLQKPVVGSGDSLSLTKNMEVYKAFNSVGPASDFLHSFHFFQQSFYGLVSTLMFGLLAFIILVYNIQLADNSSAPTHFNLIPYHDTPVSGNSGGKNVIPTGFYTSPQQEKVQQKSQTTPAVQQQELLMTSLGISLPDESSHGARRLLDSASTQSSSSSTGPSSSISNANMTEAEQLTARRLYASVQLFTNMRDANSIFNTWSLTNPAVATNMLNPPPGSPASVNVDVISSNCNGGVKITKAIGDYLLAYHGLLAGFAAFGTPTTQEKTTTIPGLCQHLTNNGIGALYMYQLTCIQWIRGNNWNFTIPVGLVCSSPVFFDQLFTQNKCEKLLNNIKDQDMMSVFFTPYNTSLTTSELPMVYAAGGPTSNVPQTRNRADGSQNNVTANSTGTLDPQTPLASDALRTLQQLPYLAALNFYQQSADLRSLCISFNVVHSIIMPTSTSAISNPGSSNPNYGTYYASGSKDYHANGYLFGLVAIGGFGLFIVLQLLLFTCVLGSRKASQHLRAKLAPSHSITSGPASSSSSPSPSPVGRPDKTNKSAAQSQPIDIPAANRV